MKAKPTRRGVLAVALVAALAIPSVVMALGAVYNYFPIRPPLTLVAASVDSVSAPIWCLGARAVFFLVRGGATENDSLSRVEVQVSQDGVSYVTTNKLGVTATAAFVGPTAFQVQRVGRLLALAPGNGLPGIPWAMARLAFSADSVIDSLSFDAWWTDDAGTPSDRRAMLPPPH